MTAMRLAPVLAAALVFGAPGIARADFAHDTARGIHKRLDAYRVANGLPKLRPDRILNAVSKRFAARLARMRKLDHHAGGRDPDQRMMAAGYRWCTYAENIAMSSARHTPEAMAAQFMK